MSNFYRGKRVFVTGGAGFIGRHLHAKLIERGAQVTIGDDLSSGSLAHVTGVWREAGLRYRKTPHGYRAEGGHSFTHVDFQDLHATLQALKGHEIVMHLAATVGGRGYIDTHPADCCEGFAINQNVIQAAHQVGVSRVQFASSACVYPLALQDTYGSRHLLKESDAEREGWAFADREYGWAKYAGEMALRAYCTQYGLRGVATRYVTAYGPYENDTHAITMLIRRAVERQDPYVVWGTGKQDRDFTYIADIVSGTLAACEKITDGSSVNIGTGTRYTIRDVISIIFDVVGWEPHTIQYDHTKPEGVKTRALDIRRARKVLDWSPAHDLTSGIRQTVAWFVKKRPRSVEDLL